MTDAAPIAGPTAAELVAAVAAWLDGSGDAAPGGFARRVAASALVIVARELADGAGLDSAATLRLRALLGRDGDRATLEADLVARLRAGAIAPDDAALLDHLDLTALATLAIDAPRYRHDLAR